jgi:hypothetical protein
VSGGEGEGGRAKVEGAITPRVLAKQRAMDW